jgi:hypothetical protein
MWCLSAPWIFLIFFLRKLGVRPPLCFYPPKDLVLLVHKNQKKCKINNNSNNSHSNNGGNKRFSNVNDNDSHLCRCSLRVHTRCRAMHACTETRDTGRFASRFAFTTGPLWTPQHCRCSLLGTVVVAYITWAWWGSGRKRWHTAHHGNYSTHAWWLAFAQNKIIPWKCLAGRPGRDVHGRIQDRQRAWDISKAASTPRTGEDTMRLFGSTYFWREFWRIYK